jgi:hypothetical protein
VAHDEVVVAHVETFAFAHLERLRPADCVQQGLAHVEVHGVAELVGLGWAGGVNPGREILGVVRTKRRTSKGAHEFPQRPIAEEVGSLLREFELHRGA